MVWRRDHFRCLGELEGDVQLCVTSRESLQSKACLSALLPKIRHMGKLVLGKGVGIWGPRSMRGHGRTPLAGGRPRTFSDCLGALRGGHSTRPFCNLFKLLKLGRLVVSKKCDNDIMKITRYCKTIYRQTICRGLVSTFISNI